MNICYVFFILFGIGVCDYSYTNRHQPDKEGTSKNCVETSTVTRDTSVRPFEQENEAVPLENEPTASSDEFPEPC